MPTSTIMTTNDGVIKLPDIASVLRDEIARLARKELRRETAALKKAVATYRSEIATLKRRVADLEKSGARVARRSVAESAPAAAAEDGGKRLRFSATRLKAMRERLGLSGPDFAALIGVSPQTIYNWEAETTRPREAQIAAIAAVRVLGKREIARRLQAQAAPAEAEAA